MDEQVPRAVREDKAKEAWDSLEDYQASLVMKKSASAAAAPTDDRVKKMRRVSQNMWSKYVLPNATKYGFVAQKRAWSLDALVAATSSQRSLSQQLPQQEQEQEQEQERQQQPQQKRSRLAAAATTKVDPDQLRDLSEAVLRARQALLPLVTHALSNWSQNVISTVDSPIPTDSTPTATLPHPQSPSPAQSQPQQPPQGVNDGKDQKPISTCDCNCTEPLASLPCANLSPPDPNLVVLASDTAERRIDLCDTLNQLLHSTLPPTSTPLKQTL
ncbi:hypothetical protein Pelo_15564 [Pelomyxa schiedti]|nr:hypothetical protein Pelo_15564 [Pelomyxa schiedti]